MVKYKKMKIALIRLPSTYANWYRVPVVGLSYVCSFLKANGFDCKIFDAYLCSWTEKKLIEYVIQYNPDVIGISSMTHEIIRAAQCANQLKKQLKTAAVVVGGCHVTALPKRTLEEFSIFDYGVYGEGEKTSLELLKCLQYQEPILKLETIKGLVFREGKQVFVNEPRPPSTSAELDELPSPSFEHYYGNNPRALAGENSVYGMTTSRGCPCNCAFCMRVLGKTRRQRSAQNICKEIEHAVSTYGAHTVKFDDENFLLNNKKTREILQFMIDRGVHEKIRWDCEIRPDVVTPELIALAKKAGCYRLGMGVESGNNKILEAINKGTTVEQIKIAAKIIKDAGICLYTFFILGHPYETKETIRDTVDLAARLNSETIAVGIMVPYPGTKVFDMALRGEGGYSLVTQDWSKYDKYFSDEVLKIKGLSHKDLEYWQKRAYITFYLRNFKILGLVKYLWERRSAIVFIFKKSVTRYFPFSRLSKIHLFYFLC